MSEWKDPEIVAFRQVLASLLPQEGAPERSWEEQRATIDGFGAVDPPSPTAKIEATMLGGVPAERIAPAGQTSRTILYLHGGGYCIGGPASHRSMVARIAEAARATCFLIDYRLAPEHPFPAAVDDALKAYRELTAGGADPSRLVIAGDSAGGGLSLATWMAARAAGLPPPAALYLISPWANVGQTGAAYAAKAKTDPVLTQDALDRFAGAYLGGKTDAKTPLASPLYGDFSDPPPMLIQVGSEEVLLSDSLGVAEAAGLAGGDVTLRVWPEMVHIWPFFAANLAAGRAAIDEAATWIRERIA
jgi:monoterpene epsilon-lactone hydrolase